MDATTQECGEVSKVTSFETIIDVYEIFIALPPNNFFSGQKYSDWISTWISVK